MNLEFYKKKDFWAGLMFLAIGAGAIIGARNYPFGTTLRMGPGYFPTMIGWILVAFGLYVMVRGLRSDEKIRSNWSIRALIVLPISMITFGILMEAAGFIPAMAALIFIAVASGREFKFMEVLLLTIFLGTLSIAMFIWGLGLPYPLIKFL
ncbi:MAG: tripartite tricarboxylate transporter TctB family protein [Deltaproteobacteria bacterium]|nr:tripartite tricarboxylate transporter TctB family protein [Deltaproteobacteria bacterium]